MNSTFAHIFDYMTLRQRLMLSSTGKEMLEQLKSSILPPSISAIIKKSHSDVQTVSRLLRCIPRLCAGCNNRWGIDGLPTIMVYSAFRYRGPRYCSECYSNSGTIVASEDVTHVGEKIGLMYHEIRTELPSFQFVSEYQLVKIRRKYEDKFGELTRESRKQIMKQHVTQLEIPQKLKIKKIKTLKMKIDIFCRKKRVLGRNITSQRLGHLPSVEKFIKSGLCYKQAKKDVLCRLKKFKEADQRKFKMLNHLRKELNLKRLLPWDIHILMDEVDEFARFMNGHVKFDSVAPIIVKKFGRHIRLNALTTIIGRSTGGSLPYSAELFESLYLSFPVQDYLNLKISASELENKLRPAFELEDSDESVLQLLQNLHGLLETGLKDACPLPLRKSGSPPVFTAYQVAQYHYVSEYTHFWHRLRDSSLSPKTLYNLTLSKIKTLRCWPWEVLK